MMRLILSVLLGYLIMGLIITAVFSVGFIAPAFAFQGQSLEVTRSWMAFTLAASVLAAMAGGFAAAKFARRREAASILAVLVFVAGVVSAIANAMREAPALDAVAGMTVQERISNAVQPAWYAFSLPFLGAAAVWIGGWIHERAVQDGGAAPFKPAADR